MPTRVFSDLTLAALLLQAVLRDKAHGHGKQDHPSCPHP